MKKLKISSAYILLFIYTSIIFCVLVVDRLSKIWALKNASNYNVNKYLFYELVFNRGISWGIFNQDSELIFSSITSLIIVVTALLAAYTYKRFKAGYFIAGELFVLAGSCSNIFDRFMYGGVIDFIVIHNSYFTWPVFNVADMAVVLGVCIMFLESNYYQSYNYLAHEK